MSPKLRRDNPKGQSELERTFGSAIASEFGRNVHLMQQRVPLGSRWIAQVRRASGVRAATIVRRLHRTDNSIRGILR